MSSHVVSDDTINRILDHFSACYFGSHGIRPSAPNIHFDWTAVRFDDPEHTQRLGEAMKAMNVRSTDRRYPGGKYPRSATFQLKPIGRASNVQAYKSLQYFIYQCNEEVGAMNTDDRKLYNTLREHLVEMGEWLITHSAEYLAAAWD